VSRLFVLDAMGLAYRAYYAFIRRPLVNSRGENTSAIFGFANTALKLRHEEKPEYWALAWDGPGPTFRHERFPDYKATRKPMPEDLLAQIPAIEDVAHALGLAVLEIPGVEADDVMGTLAVLGEHDGHEVVLVTSDKDLLTLVTDRVRVLSPAGRGEEFVWMDRAAVHEKWGVAPEQVRDVLALMGDASDNVPGVPGVGEKTAVDLIRQFGSLDALYAGLERVGRGSVREKLVAHREQAYLSRELVTVKTDLEMPWTIADLRCGPIRRDALAALAQRYELARLERVAADLGVADAEAGAAPPARTADRRGTAAETAAEGVRLAADARPGGAPPSPGAAPAQTRAAGSFVPAGAAFTPSPQGALDLWGGGAAPLGSGVGEEAFIARLHAVRARAAHGLALLPLVEPPGAQDGAIVGLALAARDGAACYLPLAHSAGPNLDRERVRKWLGPALADGSVPKVGHDLKACLHAFGRLELAIEGLDFDLRLGSFVCDPMRDHALDALARECLGLELPPLAAPSARGKPRAALAAQPPHELAASAEPRAAVLFPIADFLRSQIDARQQRALYDQIEFPLIPVLYEMERSGVLIDRAVLHEMSTRAGEEIDRLRRELLELAGEEMNLESGPQVAKVLFEKLKLKPGSKTPSGALSTRSDVLEELGRVHPFPAKLLDYRALTKLKSTYLDALPAACDPRDGRVHTTYDQAGAATGRLSSSDPNLQNIPMRTPQGRAIRRAFIAPPGALLAGADYSQIELRLMAHLAGDPQLIEAFRAGEDVHESTARRIFNVSGPLDPALRARAKVVNFGIIYGMGARSLSAQMGIGLEEAQDFIAHYFRIYARVREYLDQTLIEARRRGYVETLFGRRRYLPQLASPHGGERSLAERAAINTPIQGSAADLMKLAMIRVRRALKRFHPSARLLLQVHDELVLECAAGEANAVSERVRGEMEGCFTLTVPLRVSVGLGPTWFDVH
jgi:DNA polymerase-1